MAGPGHHGRGRPDFAARAGGNLSPPARRRPAAARAAATRALEEMWNPLTHRNPPGPQGPHPAAGPPPAAGSPPTSRPRPKKGFAALGASLLAAAGAAGITAVALPGAGAPQASQAAHTTVREAAAQVSALTANWYESAPYYSTLDCKRAQTWAR